MEPRWILNLHQMYFLADQHKGMLGNVTWTRKSRRAWVSSDCGTATRVRGDKMARFPGAVFFSLMQLRWIQFRQRPTSLLLFYKKTVSPSPHNVSAGGRSCPSAH